MPDTDRFIDIVCIICGLRKFYPKVKYKQWREKVEKNARKEAARRRTLRSKG
jgi:hypothetical protein